MTPKIIKLNPKKLVGFSQKMSYSEDKTQELFKRFMPLKSTIKNSLNTDVVALQVYTNFTSLENFSPETVFTKFALTEVSNFDTSPKNMEQFNLEAGLYAVFTHKGNVQQFYNTWFYIFKDWLPNSNYQLDQRPHFEVLPEGYNPASEDSTEEVWIPIKEL